MTKRSVDDMYGGRHVPTGRVRDGSHRRTESEPSMESAAANRTAHNTNVNQDPSNFHGHGYFNDVANAARRRPARSDRETFFRPGQRLETA